MSIIRYDKNIKDKNIGYFAEILSTHKNGGNFIADLNGAFARKPVQWRKWQIASELSKYLDDYKNSYENLYRVLKIDKIKKSESEEKNIKQIIKNIPNVIVDIVNSKEWTTFNGKPLNIGVHARLRLIERYLLNDISDIKEINEKECIEKLKNIVNVIYGQTPVYVSSRENDKSAFYCVYKDKESKTEKTKAVFGKNGVLVTVVPTEM